jgi:hypothetical protein
VRVRTRVVDARYLETSIPSTHTPSFDADPGTRLIPVNDLVRLTGAASGYTVIGGGKTAMDACTWLLESGVPPEAIRWIRPRDAWLLDRAFQQPLDLVAGLIEGVSLYLEAAAQAEDVSDLFGRLEACGQLVRLDPAVEPAMYRCATVSQAELGSLRRIENVVRLGRVVHIAADRIVLEQGLIPTDGGQVEPSASEADLPFAGLSDVLAGVPPDVGVGIPAPQREALEIALLLRPAGDQPPTAHAVALAVLTALRSCVAAGPVLVEIDDVQWLDAASLEALAFAFRRITAGPLSLLLAARTQAPADPLTASEPAPPSGWRELLAAVPAAEEIALVPLDIWQIQNLLPSTASAAQARMVARQSRGNPFWAREISASLSSSDVPVPPLAKAALTERLSRSLSPPAAMALAMVAAAGRITTADALAVLDDLADPAAAVDAAVLVGVVVETEGRIAPAHPLIGAAAVESLPPGRRTRIYQRLAVRGAR